MKAWDEGRLDNRFQAFAFKKDKLGLILLQKLFFTIGHIQLQITCAMLE
ncbi:hypothetical protein D921_01779 [Enterococcus faecalis F01966]|nr:hypothetical protein D921_01779 [Enterococcus faecalis F01966]